MKTQKRQPAPQIPGKRFAIVSARFYAELADQLEDGARRALSDCGIKAEDIEIFAVPGCFELPLAASRLIAGEGFDGIVALGVVIQGETPHFDFVAGECARGIMDVSLATGTPIGFGVLTTNTLAQAEERADAKLGDKGYEAAIAAATLLTIPRESAREPVGFRR
ncbi:MAG: 6,7-dimethyl-8-ribityllumazine synthase [Candidatus Baltobacteraceae bacterium]